MASFVSFSLTGYDTDKAWRKEGQKLATTNPRFVSRPATHMPQVLTAATLSAGGGVGMKSGGTTATKTTPTPGQSTESDLKKAISIQLQNARKLVMSQNPTATSVASSRSTLTQDGKTLTSTLRPQSAPVTPVKVPTSSTVTSSPSKLPVTSSTLSPLKVGTVTCKPITAKVVASSSPRKNVSVGTNPQTSVVAVTLQAAKPKGGSSPSLDGASKKSKLSAIESLLCEETISPKSSPGPAPSPGIVKDEVPATPPDHTSVKKAEVSKTEMEKRQPKEEAIAQKIEPPDDSQKVKQPNAATGASENKSEPKTTDSVEAKSVQNIETRPTDDVETKPTADKLSSQDLTIQKETITEASEKKPLPSSDVKTDTEAKPQAAGSSDAAMEQTTLEDSTLKQSVSEIAPVTNSEMVKTETITVSSASVEISRPANIELSKPIPPQLLAIPTAPEEKEDVTVTKGARKRSPSPSLNESDQPPPAKKQAIAPQQDDVVPSPSPVTISAGQPPSAKGQAIELQSSVVAPSPSSISTSGQPPLAQKQATATHKNVITPPTNVSDIPPPAKKQAIEPQKDVTIPSIFTSTTTARISASTATTTVQASIPITGTSTVTVTVLGSSMDMGTHGAATGFDITPPSQLPTEVNTDSLIQSLCSDSTSFEDPPDVSVLASQLGIDSVDSPVFNLSGFLSLIQPDLSVLTPEEQSSAIGGKLLSDISGSEEQSSAITGPPLGDVSSSEEQSSAISGQLLATVSSGAADQKPPEGTVGENTAETTKPSFLATPTLPVAVSSPLQPEVTVSIPSTLELPVPPATQELLKTSSTSAPPVSLPPAPVAESITATPMSVLSPVMLPEEPIPPRPLVLRISTDTPSVSQAPPPLLGTPITPTPLAPTPLTPLGEGLLDLSDISSLMDESEVMEGISQDVFESIEKLVNLDEQSTNATWK